MDVICYNKLMKPVRTRFAPSPTGFLHVGGIRTALFAWLVARQANGKFILRFEDTDKKREVEGARQHLIDSLLALGLEYDEGPDKGGPFAPYTQSERLDSYQTWAQKLVDAGRAYADPYTPEDVQAFREQAQAAKQPFLYRNHRPENPPAWDGSQPLRFKSDPDYLAHWANEGPVVDEVMGELNINPQATDDFILIKGDGFPTYNFAHIIDDHEMQITHVIRGQEFISSMPGYLDLYHALGFERPLFAHLPHVLNEAGNKKLSKRDGAKDVLDYLKDGFLPETMINFIATLGWNDGTEQEIFSRTELIEKFKLSQAGRGGAHFDERRLEWMNGVYIRNLPLDELYERVKDYWPSEATEAGEDYKKQVLGLVQERLKYLAELPELTRFFFINLPLNPELISGHKQLKKFSAEELKSMLETAKESLEQSDFSVDDLTSRLNALLEQTEQKPAVLFSLIRIATTQAPASPGLAESLVVLGKDRSLMRIDQQLAAL
jgi:glutamyl-tRNA synthetase